MKNTYFNLPKYTLDGITYSNIFPTYKNLNILNSYLSNNSYMWYYKDIVDDTRLELLSFQEYNDSKYWDVLFYVNNMETIFDLPTNFDNIQNEIDRKLEFYSQQFGNYIDPAIKLRLEENIINKNEKYRRFRFIKQEYLSQVLSIINGI